jgi:hypothetical protein
MIEDGIQTEFDLSIVGSMDSQAESLSSDLSLLDLLNLSENVSVRLLNAVTFAASQKKLPYDTVAAYVNAGETGRSRMMEIDNLGRKSLAELDQIIAERVDHHYSPDSHNELLSLVEDEELLRLPLDEFLVKQRSVGTRLFNAISSAASTGTCPFESVADYVRCDTRQQELRKVENLGRASAIEFERLVARFITSKSYMIEMKIGESGFVDVGHIVRDVYSLLSPRQQEVVLERFLKKKTLEATASIRGITRERVRQIEAKAVRILSTKFAVLLRESAEAICAKLGDDELFELTTESFSQLVECDISEATVYLAYLKKLDLDHSSLATSGDYVFISDHFVPRDSWKQTLQEGLLVQSLPLVIDRVISAITTVPAFYIREYFERKWGAQYIDEPGSAIPSYGTTRMCIDVLRKAGGPLHISDVRARIYSLFDVDVEEHAINATLGRLKECAIAGPGKYVLYECLPYTSSDLVNIRSISYDHLKSKGVFLSSKILFDEAFAPTSDKYPVDFNHYLMMGFVQDDERFTTKRGNMIGLMSFDVAEAYTPLQDEIHRIVLEHGPISLPEISERLSATRRLCNDSGIRLVLNQWPDLIRIGRRTYDALHRFFDTRQDYEDLLLAIRISLLEKKKTTYSITQNLVRLGLAKVTPQLVESLILSMDDIKSQVGVHELIEQDDDIAQYNETVVQSIQNGQRQEDVLERLQGKMPSERIEKFLSVDGRFNLDISPTSPKSEESEIALILRDFDF